MPLPPYCLQPRRLMLEVVEAVANAVGADRTGIRLSPFNEFLSAQDSLDRAIEKNIWLVKEIEKRLPNLAYIHMVSRLTPLLALASWPR